MLNAKSWPPTLKVTSWTSSSDAVSEGVQIEDRHQASALLLRDTRRPRQRVPAGNGQRLLADDGIGVIHLERYLPATGAELDQHNGARTAGRRRRSFRAGEKGTEVDQGDEPAAQRRQAAYRRELARNTEHLGGIADLQHPIDREAVRFSLGANQQIAFHRVPTLKGGLGEALSSTTHCRAQALACRITSEIPFASTPRPLDRRSGRAAGRHRPRPPAPPRPACRQ